MILSLRSPFNKCFVVNGQLHIVNGRFSRLMKLLRLTELIVINNLTLIKIIVVKRFGSSCLVTFFLPPAYLLSFMASEKSNLADFHHSETKRDKRYSSIPQRRFVLDFTFSIS